jgi:micrococcal nuclease
MLQFKQREYETEDLPPRWNLGVDRRLVGVYVGVALIAGFCLGLLTYRYLSRKEPAASPIANGTRTPVPQAAADTPTGEFRRVTRLLRADTIEVEGVGPVRLIGIETPDGKLPQEIYGVPGQQALSFAEKSLLGKEVRLEYDSAGDRDSSGQLIAYVYTSDGVLINAEILKQGLGMLRGGEQFRLASDFRGYEREAMQAMRGVWGSSSSSSSTSPSTVSSSSSPPPSTASAISSEEKAKKLSPLSPSALGPNVPALSGSGGGQLEQSVWVSAADKMYHKSGCEYLDKKKHSIPISQAKSQGYTACSRCFASTVLKAP